MNSYYAIVLAAGSGKRLDVGYNKQFVRLKDKPVIAHTISIFDNDPYCEEIILVIRPEDQGRAEKTLLRECFSTPIKLIRGGKERQDSAYNGLMAIQDKSKFVFIHDGARPFVSQNALDRLNQAVEKSGAALLAVSAQETIKQKTGPLLKTLDRPSLYIAQTPQAFTYDKILRGHEQAQRDQFQGTDDASLVERLGEYVELVKGEFKNIKITTPEDLDYALFILNKKEKFSE